jgi:hypothetical protein
MKLFIEKIRHFKIASTSLYLDLIEKYKIRDDFFKFYKACAEAMLKSPEMDSRTKAPGYYWYKEVIRNGYRAKNFDPHKSIVKVSNNIVEFIDIVDSLFTTISIITTFVTALFGVITFVSLIQNWSSSILFGLLFSLLLVLKGFFYIYKQVLILDTEMIQIINSKLIFEQNDLLKIRGRKSSLIAANIWNSSLCKSNTFMVLFELMLLKSLFRSIYTRIYQRLIDDVAPYIPEYIKNPRKINYIIYFLGKIVS